MGAVGAAASRDLIVCHVGHALVEAARRMRDADVGVVFVLDAEELVGVVTDRDLVIRGLALGGKGEHRVEEVMTRHVVSCREGASIKEAGAAMGADRVRRLAVLNRREELVGVVSLADLARSPAGATVAAGALRAICRPLATAKMPGPEDPTGGHARKSPAGDLHSYGERPRLRRRASKRRC
jgi:CBS domain-containing protein